MELSARQRGLYKALLANVSVQDLLEKAANLGDADSARSLMNLVMQFRKVCNHPELFERADVVAPFSFSEFGRSGPLNREGDFVVAPYSTRNPIEYGVPSRTLQLGEQYTWSSYRTAKISTGDERVREGHTVDFHLLAILERDLERLWGGHRLERGLALGILDLWKGKAG